MAKPNLSKNKRKLIVGKCYVFGIFTIGYIMLLTPFVSDEQLNRAIDQYNIVYVGLLILKT